MGLGELDATLLYQVLNFLGRAVRESETLDHRGRIWAV